MHLLVVSIPIGFSHQLRRKCDGGLPGWRVSIPIGFSHQLRRHFGGFDMSRLASFNPYRVFSSAETSHRSGETSPDPCFNPYRVFSSAETPPRHGPAQTPGCFNPYRVFSSAETYRIDKIEHHRTPVSIPIGFSHQLRQTDPGSRRGSPPVSIPIGFSHQLRPQGS